MNLRTIEKGVPIPPDGRGRGNPELPPIIKAMEPGDSFLEKKNGTGYAMRVGRKLGVRLASRYVGDGLCRIWRVA